MQSGFADAQVGEQPRAEVQGAAGFGRADQPRRDAGQHAFVVGWVVCGQAEDFQRHPQRSGERAALPAGRNEPDAPEAGGTAGQPGGKKFGGDQRPDGAESGPCPTGCADVWQTPRDGAGGAAGESVPERGVWHQKPVLHAGKGAAVYPALRRGVGRCPV